MLDTIEWKASRPTLHACAKWVMAASMLIYTAGTAGAMDCWAVAMTEEVYKAEMLFLTHELEEEFTKEMPRLKKNLQGRN